MQSFPPSERITIKDIAAKAGVAVTTVSSALHRNGRVSEKQRAHIQALAREMGYQPKIAAQLLRSNLTGHVGLFLPEEEKQDISQTGHVGPILSNFVKACEQRALPYHVEFVDVETTGDFEPPKLLAGGVVDGVLVGGFVNPHLRQWMNDKGFSWVSVDEPSDYCVVSADDDGIYQAAQRMAALGHRKFAYLGGPTIYNTQRLALEGFEKAVADFNIEIPEEGIKTFDAVSRVQLLNDAAEWAASVLATLERPTAILCHNTVLARGVIYQTMQMGLNIPNDLSIIAVGPAIDAEKALPCLSTIEVDFESLVDRALDLHVRKIRKEPAMSQPQKRIISPRLVMRQTVAPFHCNT